MGNGLHTYYPELGDKRPDCEIEAELAYYGKHYFLDTKLALSGRGIEHIKTYGSDYFKDGEKNRKFGWNQYKVTIKAFEAIKARHSVGSIIYLD